MRTKELKRLNFHHLYYFWVVAKEGHLTRVADYLHVSQSALSSQIRQLEETLGHTLFDRDGRALRLTEAGRLVLDYAESIFNLGSELLATVQSGDAMQVARLRVGAVATLSRNFQESFLQPVLDRPGLQLVLESASLEELLERLRIHRLDLILSNRLVTPGSNDAWRCRRIARQQVCLVGPARDESSRFRFPEDLPEARLILPGHSSDIRSQFDLLCEEHGVKYQIFAEVEDMAMLRLLARDSGGVAVVPEVVVRDELQQGRLQRYAVLPTVYEYFYAITAPRHVELPLLNDLFAAVGEGMG